MLTPSESTIFALNIKYLVLYLTLSASRFGSHFKGSEKIGPKTVLHEVEAIRYGNLSQAH